MDHRILLNTSLLAKQIAENLIKLTRWKGHDKYTGRWWFWASHDQNAPQLQAQNCIYCGNYIQTNTWQNCPANIRCNCINDVMGVYDLMDIEQIEADWQTHLDFREGRREFCLH